MMFSDKRLCFDPEGFKLFLKTLQKTFGSAGDAMIFQMSTEYGQHLLLHIMPLEDHEHGDPLAAVKRRFKYMGELGWGEFTLDEYSPEEGVIKINYRSDVITPLCSVDDNVMCLFIKGTLLGAFNQMTGLEFRVENVDCVNDESTKCSFTLKALF